MVMEIEGTYTLQASPEVVWQSLTDCQQLLTALPAITALKSLDAQSYALTMQIEQSLLKGSYTGKVTIVEPQAPYHCRLLIESDGQSNTLSGSGMLHLNQRDQTTVIVYQGDMQIIQAGTAVPHSLSKGVTKMLVQQLLTGLANQLRPLITTEAIGEIGTPEVTIVQQQADFVVLPPVTDEADRPYQPQLTSLAHYVVQRLHLGGDDSQAVARWTERIRRVGIVTGLLFLVWVGTRLPRR